MKEAKLLDCKFHEFEAMTNDLLRQEWEIVIFAPQGGYISALFTRDVATPTPDTPISAAPAGVTFGERLRWLRDRADLTLAEVSSMTGLSISYLSDMEHGRTLPTMVPLYKLAAAYGMTASDLLRGVDLDEAVAR